MTFKENVTQNIYTSWINTCSTLVGKDNLIRVGGYELKELSLFTLNELNHLKWLIDQEIGARDADK